MTVTKMYDLEAVCWGLVSGRDGKQMVAMGRALGQEQSEQQPHNDHCENIQYFKNRLIESFSLFYR